jgi:tetratricopeptide (TPR) repeat protein
MGFRFFKRMNILPGVQLNLSKGGGSISLGPQGAKLTVGTSGARVTFGIPGTGLFYTTNFSLGKLGRLFGQPSGSAAAKESARSTAQESKTQVSARPDQEQLTPDFFDELSVPDDQKELAAGCRALAKGDEDKALAHLRNATHLGDGAFLAGVLALKKGQLQEAAQYLMAAAAQESALGRHLSRYGVTAMLSLAVTEEVSAHVGPDIRGVLLALAEVYQRQEKRSEAIQCLEQLRKLEPADVLVRLSLAELLMENGAPTKDICQKVVQLAEKVENDTAIHTALLLYKAKALRTLGWLDAAREILTKALKQKKGRSADLLRALRYERALVYENQGERKKARMELEKLYSEAPEYEDVKTRLGR